MKYYVCNKPGYWSNRYISDEYNKTYNKFCSQSRIISSRNITLVRFLIFLVTYENIERLNAPNNVLDTITEINIHIDWYKDNNSIIY
jgi:hypothetical protein